MAGAAGLLALASLLLGSVGAAAPELPPTEAGPPSGDGTATLIAGTCGRGEHADAPDCGNVDKGSCGNACCKLAFVVGEDPATAAGLLNRSLAGGGPDGLFTPQMTAEGTLGFADLRPFNQSVDFIGQVHHMTSGPSHFNDTIDFTVAPRECVGGLPCSAEGSIIRVFSTSLIAGAFGDNGQNYKNIALVMKNIAWKTPPAFGADAHQDASCPPPAGERAEGKALI